VVAELDADTCALAESDLDLGERLQTELDGFADKLATIRRRLAIIEEQLLA